MSTQRLQASNYHGDGKTCAREGTALLIVTCLRLSSSALENTHTHARARARFASLKSAVFPNDDPAANWTPASKRGGKIFACFREVASLARYFYCPADSTLSLVPDQTSLFCSRRITTGPFPSPKLQPGHTVATSDCYSNTAILTRTVSSLRDGRFPHSRSEPPPKHLTASANACATLGYTSGTAVATLQVEDDESSNMFKKVYIYICQKGRACGGEGGADHWAQVLVPGKVFVCRQPRA